MPVIGLTISVQSPKPTGWKERNDSCALSSDLHMHMHAHKHTCTHAKYINVKSGVQRYGEGLGKIMAEQEDEGIIVTLLYLQASRG